MELVDLVHGVFNAYGENEWEKPRSLKTWVSLLRSIQIFTRFTWSSGLNYAGH